MTNEQFVKIENDRKKELRKKVVNRRATYLGLLVVFGCLAFVAVVVVICIQVYQVSQLSSYAKVNRSTLNTLNDCTNPAGACYQNGPKSAIAAWCANQPGNQTARQVVDCTRAELAKENNGK